MNQHPTLPGIPDPIGPPQKRCATCGDVHALGMFYADRSRCDGLTRECRTCDAERHRRRWRANAERLRAHARQRYAANIVENRERGAERRRSERGKAINRLAVARYSERNREKRAAHAAVRRAIRAGTLQRPERCEFSDTGCCNGRVEYHHDDYDRPLDVRALCTEHHAQAHHKPRSYSTPAPLFEIGARVP